MVHGGGHHTSSTGGGGGSSSSSGGFHHHHHNQGNRNGWNNRSNVVVVNQQQRGYNPGSPWYTGRPLWSSTNPQYRDAEFHSSERSERSSAIDGDARERLGGDEETRAPNKLCQALCLSIVILVALLAFSQLDTTWTLNVGETRHVRLPVLNNRIDISTDDKIGVRVYDFPGKECPSLTGPTVTLEDENTLHLGTGDYQYDYFFLNKGSVLNLDYHQTKGATNIFILRGESNLQRLEGYTDDDDDDHFRRQALKKRYVAEGGHSSGSFQYTAKQNNVYMIVYDNVSPATTGTILVHYTTTLTTYNLHGQEPVCDESVDTCSIDLPNRMRCILVQAISDSGDHTSDEIVSVEVTGTRCWSFLLFYSAMPFIFFLLRSLCQLRSSRSSYQPVGSLEEPNPPPTAPESVEPIRPPTAPPSESEPLPSAPPEARLVETEPDYSGIIIIPAENVIPVPPPTDK
jgi:hypothetical protein